MWPLLTNSWVELSTETLVHKRSHCTTDGNQKAHGGMSGPTAWCCPLQNVTQPQKGAVYGPWCGLWPTGSLCCGCDGQIHTDCRSPVEKKGLHSYSLVRERALTPAWIGFYCFSGHITLRMVLMYYAQFRCRWLPFTDNKGKNVANYFKEKDVANQGEKWLN